MSDEPMTAAPDLMPHLTFQFPSPAAPSNHVVTFALHRLRLVGHPLICKCMFVSTDCAIPDSFREVFRDVKNASF